MKKKILWLFTVIISVSVFSCKEDTNFGLNIIPDDDKTVIEIDDTTTILSYTTTTDSTVISQVNTLLLGSYNDPVFGNSSAGFAIQFVPGSGSLLTETDVLDSLVLSLPFVDENWSYGVSNTSQEILVYRMREQLVFDSIYYSSKNPAEIHNNELIGSFTYNPSHDKDSIVTVKLNDSFMAEFINQGSGIFTSDSVFFEFLNGIYVTPANHEANAAIIKYNLNSNTKMSLHFHSSNSYDTTNLSFVYGLSAVCSRVNFFKHNYNNSTFYNNINNENITDSVSYIQAMSGVETKLVMPYINLRKNTNSLAVLRAELIIKTENQNLSYENQYNALNNIVLKVKNTDGIYYFPADYISEYNESGGKEYSFDIADYINKILTGKEEHQALFLSAYPSKDEFSRSVITSGIHSNKIKLVITYNKL